jgi:hypothetical protein
MIPDPTPDSIIQHLLDRFEGTRVVAAGGERSMFYNPGGKRSFDRVAIDPLFILKRTVRRGSAPRYPTSCRRQHQPYDY